MAVAAQATLSIRRKFVNRTYLTVSAAVVALLSTAPAALAIPPGDDDGPIRCPPGYILVDEICVKKPPPPPSNSPVVQVNLARQNIDQNAIRVSGRATDADQPATALTVQIAVDGVLKRTLVANLPDPPVATQGVAKIISPPTVPGHGFDVTVLAPANAQNVCITAFNVGSTGSNRTTCSPIDNVVEFAGNSLNYNLALAKITSATLVEVDRIDHENGSSVTQSTSITGTKTITDTHTLKHEKAVKVTVKTEVGLPLVGSSDITVEGSYTWGDETTHEEAKTFSWNQTVIVPPHRRVVGTVALTETSLEVPYSIVGDFVYDSGFRVPGTVGGKYAGTQGHDLQVDIEEFELDGTPAAKAAPQPEPTLLQQG
jgi:Clostridium epsilon toxin ETX/Bacillus mosquitocidal toxin MTX2